jgi:hypothetical protein
MLGHPPDALQYLTAGTSPPVDQTGGLVERLAGLLPRREG